MRGRKSIFAMPALTAFGTSVLCLLFVFPVRARTSEQSSKLASRAQIEHGKYIVDNLAGCADCHTPMGQKGEPVPGQYLKGAKLSFGPLVPVPNWVTASPEIAGLHGWTTRQAIHFLMTGIDRNGQHAHPPMPQYRMSRADATDVVAYLKSLK